MTAQWLLIVYSHEISITPFKRYADALAAFRAIEAGGDFRAALARQMMATNP
jgi:hypothetical protein